LGGNLESVASLILNGGGQQDRVILNDSGNPYTLNHGHDYTVSNTQVSRSVAQRVSSGGRGPSVLLFPVDVEFTGTETLELLTGGSFDRINVASVPLGNSTIDAGAGSDTIRLTPATGDLDLIRNLTVVGGNGSGQDTIEAFDANAIGPVHIYTVTDASLLRQSLGIPAPIVTGFAYRTIENLKVTSGLGIDLVAIGATPGPSTFDSGGGTDVFTVGNSLANIRGKLTLEGGAGANTLSVNDSAAPGDIIWSYGLDQVGPTFSLDLNSDRRLEASSMSGVTLTTTAFDDFVDVINTAVAMSLNTGDGDDSLTVRAVGAPATVNTGAGGDTITVGVAMHPLSGDRLLTLNLGEDFDTLNLDDRAQSTDRHYTLAGGTFWYDGASLEYQSAETLNFFAGSGDDMLDVTGVPPGTLPHVYGGGNGEKGDTLTGSNAVNNFLLLGPDWGLGNSHFFYEWENLAGDLGIDTFIISNGAGAGVSGWIDGGGGQEDKLSYTQLLTQLSYASFDGDVLVNLPQGTATAIGSGEAGHVRNIQHVIGAAGNDVLIGNDRANRLEGRTGRDILIGGEGMDTLDGGGGEDILIGGTTALDTDVVALQMLQAGWAMQDLLYQDRIENLRRSQLNATTVLDDETVDELMGGDESDWFWTSVQNIPADYDLLTEILN
jgi:Ca2+-binding RTX toxin-like protein